jgi:hypothetical protein
MNKTIELPCYGIRLEISGKGGTITSDLKEGCPCCGSSDCWFDCDESKAEDSPESEDEARSRIELNRVIDGIESLVLAAACEGIDVELPAFLAAIETAVEAAGNNT